MNTMLAKIGVAPAALIQNKIQVACAEADEYGQAGYSIRSPTATSLPLILNP